MPTFDAISFSADLANRLVALEGSSLTRMDTPQAFLSRNPDTLRLQKEDGSISTDPLHCNGFPELRHEVATKLMALSSTGKRQKLVESTIHQTNPQPEQDEAAATTTTTKARGKVGGGISVLDLLKYQKLTTSNDAIISTGSTSLDNLLSITKEMAASLSSSLNPGLCIPLQGLPWGHIIQCSGPSACGKTQVALQLAVSAASQNLLVLYLNTALGQGSLRPLAFRFKTLARAVSETNHQVNSTLDRVSFQTLHDGYQLLTCLNQLEDNISALPKVVILDAASGCLTNEDETFLHQIVLRLRLLARHSNALIWINNSSTMPKPTQPQRHSIDGLLPMGDDTPTASSSKTNKPKVALGSLWKRVWDVHVSFQTAELQQASSSSSASQLLQVRAKLEGHPFKNCNETMTAAFTISATGVQDLEPEEEDS